MMRLFELRTTPMDVVLRALAILMIAYNHAHLRRGAVGLGLGGGMTFLLLLSGMNFARFAMAGADATSVRRSILVLARQVYIPSVLLVLLAFAVAQRFSWSELLFFQNFMTTRRFGFFAQWYPQILLQLLAFYYLLFSIPPVAGLLLRYPARAMLALFAVALALRAGGPLVWNTWHLQDLVPHLFWWNFVLGSLLFFLITETGRSKWWSTLAALTCVIVGALIGWSPTRLDFWWLIGSATLLVTIKQIQLPAVLARAVVLVSGATFAIFLLHYLWFRIIKDGYRLLKGCPAGPCPQGVVNPDIVFVVGVALCLICWIAFKAFVRAYRGMAVKTGRIEQTA